MTETAERPSTTRLPAAERRQQLLAVALETFAAKGFHGTSMNEVAEAAGVTKPVLYQHFASKKALYHELVDEVGAQLGQVIFEAVAEADGPRQQVEAGFRAYFRWAVGQGSAFRVLFSDRNRADAELADAVARVEAMVADRVAGLIAIEGLSDDERHVMAFGVVGIAEATSRRWLALGLGQGRDADAFADRVAQLAWSGLRGITPPRERPAARPTPKPRP
jgi:AcrR family transcriptional regulator